MQLGVMVEVLAGSVVSQTGAGVGVAGCDLHVTEVNSCVEHGGHERVPEYLRSACREPGARSRCRGGARMLTCLEVRFRRSASVRALRMCQLSSCPAATTRGCAVSSKTPKFEGLLEAVPDALVGWITQG